MDGLRIVSFNVFPVAYQLVAGWAERNGHRLVLVVTSPGPAGVAAAGSVRERFGSGVPELIASAPRTQDFLVTTRMKRVATPVIRALEPDLIVSVTFPHRIPPELVAIPRFGAVNLHPTLLPRGRGPNAMRQIYEGEPALAMTAHRITPEFDAGPILSQQVRPALAEPTVENLFAVWDEAAVAALEEATQRAIAGDPGTPQDDAQATYAAPFTDAECRLDLREPARTLQRRVMALNVPVPGRARAEIGGTSYAIVGLRPLSGEAGGEPGTLLHRAGATLTVRAGDGPIEVQVAEAEPMG
jgi:methionyl-tRNA formyltransferase